eukprot:GHVS01093666.1.p1 GENE.GHVS01093666.1~~GHVS01093666.1.p1  ORF type:complete len:341 (+),score=70.39 GHVS01093666.1:47-1024(+)
MNPSDSPILSPSAICSPTVAVTSRTTSECSPSQGSTPGVAPIPKRKSLFPRSVFGQVSSIFTSSTNRPKSKPFSSTRSDNNTTTTHHVITHDDTTTPISVSHAAAVGQRTADSSFLSSQINNQNYSSQNDDSFIENFPDLHLSSLTLTTSDSDSSDNNNTQPSQHHTTTTQTTNTTNICSPVAAFSKTPTYNSSHHHTHTTTLPSPKTNTGQVSSSARQNHSYGAGLGGLGSRATHGDDHQGNSRSSRMASGNASGNVGRATTDNYRNSGHHGSASAATDSARDAKGKLYANVENLKRLENKTAQMAAEAESFADLSKQLRQKYS